jgi:hypothetical protein
MERIFLAMIVSGLLLATTSTALLVVGNDAPVTVSAMSLPAPSLASGMVRPRLAEQDKPATPSDARREQARF